MPPARRQDWAVAPTLLWFSVFVAAAFAFSDQGVGALADRIARRSHRPPPRAFGAAGRADTDTDDDLAAVADTDTGGHAAARAATIEDVCVDGTAERCKRWAMDGFYRAVADARAGNAGRPVRVSYYGDSVTATDDIPAHVRARLQAELGDGGPGFLWVAKPHRFVFHAGVTTTDLGEWTTWGVSTHPALDGLDGVGGSSTETVSGIARLTSKTSMTEVEVYYLAQPGGGTTEVVLDGQVAGTIDTRADRKVAGFDRIHASGPARKLELRASGRVRYFGVVLENPGGAVVDNMGLVSATVKNLAHNRADHWQAQLTHRAADLVIIMLGANEAAWLPRSKRAMAEYTTQYEAILAPIRAGLPRSGCLVVSPLDQAYELDGDLVSRPVMPVMVAAQRAAARAAGCAFFSAYDWAGGKGSALAWYDRHLVGDDFIHLSPAGAVKLGDALVDALLAGARDYHAR